MAAADITLVHGGVGAVADAVMLARATRRIIRQNLGWAFGYNLLLVPVAAGALYAWDGLLLDPVLASAAMAMAPPDPPSPTITATFGTPSDRHASVERAIASA